MTSYTVWWAPLAVRVFFLLFRMLGHAVDCQQFIKSGCLPLTLTVLSSPDVTLRRMAYTILVLFQGHMETSMLKEKRQVMVNID